VGRPDDPLRRIGDGVKNGGTARKPRFRALSIVDRCTNDKARRLTLVVDSPRADQNPEGFAMGSVASGLEPIHFAGEIELANESIAILGIEQCQNVSGIASYSIRETERVRRGRVGEQNPMIRLTCHRDDNRHRFDELTLCRGRAIARNPLLLASRFALETVQHGIESIDQLSNLAAGSVARSQTVVLAIT